MLLVVRGCLKIRLVENGSPLETLFFHPFSLLSQRFTKEQSHLMKIHNTTVAEKTGKRGYNVII